MSVTYYKHKHFNGVFGKIGPGFYYGQGLAGCGNMSSQCEDLSRNISSLRIDDNIIVALGDSVTARAGVRVLMGPMEVPDVSAIRMDGKVVSAFVVEYGTLLVSGRQVGATIFNNGRRAFLSRGDYNSNRLASEEVKIPSDKITSISVLDNTIVVLSASESFRPDALAVMLVGPTEANLDGSAFSTIHGNIRAIRVLSGRQLLPVTLNQNIYPRFDTHVFDTHVFDTSVPKTHVFDTPVPKTHVFDTSVPKTHVFDTSVPRKEHIDLVLIIIILLLAGCCMSSRASKTKK